MFQVKKLSDSAKTPEKAYDGDAGWDLFNDEEKEIWIQPGERTILKTGCSFSIPDGYYGRIADRSSCAWKQGVHVMAGVVDSKYRGEVKIILINLGPTEKKISPGDKIAQLIITKIGNMELKVVDSLIPGLCKKHTKIRQRGSDGFGSSNH